ncbi:Core-2/I-branching beta-1,6-N-acetylglucosaminyltransferase family protein [Heracleum sosnowskyi]|uniref:Core-2/I-branching beta-1,6-N-acetylglucosaminyltransferase family protein n=1 Tax=Heracleum sosnowskyi TaxID=360622 RepID=A0AAD8HCE4_9APIA|nr:Core-2/I-branching beta-1,6-N-acetylglucosaminyltransferase family protein [Heracleum sosnowskyi]
MFERQLSIRIRREHGGGLQVASTIILCISVTFFVFVLATFINDRAKRFSVSDDFYIPESYLISTNPSNPYILCNSSSSSYAHHIISEQTISPKDLWHSMSDEELIWHATMVPVAIDPPFKWTPKVAYMFLARGRLPLAPLWEKFFDGHDELFSIYLHTSPEFTSDPPESSIFYKRRIPSKPVQWGKETMIDAERRLLANALLDFTNERFVLLSETCIPVFNFTFIYNYLINSNQSFLSSFDDPRKMGRGKYNKRMFPAITISDWRKGSQWFEANRKLAIQLISDTTYYPIFRTHCQRPCFMDEHYFPTLVNKICPDLTTNRTVTWTDWSRGGSHPAFFMRNQISQEFLNHIRYGYNCSYNGEETSTCYLFARKFHPNTLQPLLSIAPTLLGFNT